MTGRELAQTRLPDARPARRRLLARLGARWLAVAGPGVLGLVGAATIGIGIQIHEPRIHDEFSFLLAAETFAAGRLTNPTHPMWQHFETFHVVSTPTTMSKYPPGQGLLLAAGKVLGGDPVVGSWIGVGLMAAAIAWLTAAWLPARWAALAGVLAVLRYGLVGMEDFANWGQSYWGGQLAAAAGALALGSLIRIFQGGSRGAGWTLGIGLAGLASTRPYEGLLVTGGAAVVALVGGWRADSRTVGPGLRRHLGPTLLVLAVAASALAYDNSRVTGDPLLLPYVQYERSYGLTPLFLFQSPRPLPSYRHDVMRDFYVRWAARPYERQRRWSTLWGEVHRKVRDHWRWYLGLSWTLPALLGLFLGRGLAHRMSVAGLLAGGAGNLISTYSQPHYLAPATGAVLGLVVGSVYALSTGRGPRIRAVGRIATATLVLVTLADTLRRIPSHQNDAGEWQRVRVAIEETLAATPERDVILVRYRPGHSYHQEWVYNHAAIDESPVAWARAMEPARDHELIEYFRDRKAWLLEVGDSDFELRRFPARPAGG